MSNLPKSENWNAGQLVLLPAVQLSYLASATQQGQGIGLRGQKGPQERNALPRRVVGGVIIFTMVNIYCRLVCSASHVHFLIEIFRKPCEGVLLFSPIFQMGRLKHRKGVCQV